MNDSELDNLLRQARVPERSAEGWEELAADTVRQAGRDVSHKTGAVKTSRPTSRAFVWAAGFAAACIVFGFVIGRWHSKDTARSDEIAQAHKLFAELSAMFPNQLQSVVLDGSTPQLVLADKPSTGKGAPLFVRICGTKGCQRVITFSGERVQLAGENCDVLVDAAGHVIISGERFVWSSGDRTSRNGDYRFEARQLTGVL